MAFPFRWLPRIDGRRSTTFRGHNEDVILEPRNGIWVHVDRTATERLDGSAPAFHFGRDVATLPGDHRATDLEQRKRQLDELREVCDSANDHRRPSFSVSTVASQGLRSLGGDAQAISQIERLDDGRQKPCLLCDRVDEERLFDGQRDHEREPRKTPATAEVDEAPNSEATNQRQGRQAVEDVSSRDGVGISDRCEIDRLCPSQQQPNVSCQRVSSRGVDLEPERDEARIEGPIE